jgi:hypothetical protein
MGRQAQRRKSGGFLTRLARDERGNVLAMSAAALLPLLGIIGSGLDVGRAYMTKNKLQAACDASALAARAQMGAGRVTAGAIAEGTRYFHFNFPPGTMEAKPVSLAIGESPTDHSVIEVKASTEVPTTIMRIFGFTYLPIEIACSADKDYVNNDIMLVLDVTGSMNCAAGSTCEIQQTEAVNSRLSRLRNATVSLYRALAGATGVRTRYGFMPYSQTVNVGRDLNINWVTSPATYHQFTCIAFNNNGSCRTQGWTTVSATRRNDWLTSTGSGCVEERSTISQNGANAIRISTEVTQADIDAVSATDNRLKWQPFNPIATTGQYAITTDASSWYETLLRQFCPAPARKLATYAGETAFQNQVNASLSRVGGYTNHDLGITWGMRYLSSTGPFAAENPTEWNSIRVAKHIVFLTDGVMTSNNTNYSAYGIHAAETRWIGSGTTIARHRARFLNACNRARQMGATIWVIALDVQSPEDIRPCASGDDHFFISNGSDLDQVFTLIGRGIGRLRLTA